MADAPEPSGGKSNFGFLTRKLGPFPVWLWAAGALGGYYWYTKYGPGKTAGGTVTDPAGNTCSAVNPATGYCPGTAEDQAATQSAGGYAGDGSNYAGPGSSSDGSTDGGTSGTTVPGPGGVGTPVGGPTPAPPSPAPKPPIVTPPIKNPKPVGKPVPKPPAPKPPVKKPPAPKPPVKKPPVARKPPARKPTRTPLPTPKPVRAVAPATANDVYSAVPTASPNGTTQQSGYPAAAELGPSAAEMAGAYVAAG